jgi:hypothetical protein
VRLRSAARRPASWSPAWAGPAARTRPRWPAGAACRPRRRPCSGCLPRSLQEARRGRHRARAGWNLIDSAKRQIDLLGYTLYFLALDHPELVSELQSKCANGCRIRAIIADPRSRHVDDRDREEGQPITLVARIGTTMKYFHPLRDCSDFEMRYQDVPLYNSVFRFDDQMLVTPHLYATPGSAAPMIHLRRLAPNGMFSRFAKHFEDVWSVTAEIDEADWK